MTGVTHRFEDGGTLRGWGSTPLRSATWKVNRSGYRRCFESRWVLRDWESCSPPSALESDVRVDGPPVATRSTPSGELFDSASLRYARLPQRQRDPASKTGQSRFESEGAHCYYGSMQCEHCSHEHDGGYGAGRFCGWKCARSYSTASRRLEINAKISRSLKGRPAWSSGGFRAGYDPRRPSQEVMRAARVRSGETSKANAKMRLCGDWDSLSFGLKRKRVLHEQDSCCLHCGLNEWRGQRLVIEIDHVDGDHDNDARENLRGLCPNCHSQTPTWKGRNKDRVSQGGNGAFEASKVGFDSSDPNEATEPG